MTTFEKIRKAALARLDAGEPVHIILQDYADFEDELRPVLEKASGKVISFNSTTKPKNKNKRQTSNPLLLIVGALSIIAIGFIAIFFGTSTSFVELTTVTGQTETTCIGIPQPQITSQYALNQQNQANNQQSELGIVVDEPMMDYESAEEGAPMPMPPAMGGGGDSAESVTIVATSVVTMDMDESSRAFETDSVDLADSDGDYEEYASDDIAPVAPSRNTPNTDPLRAGEIDDNAEWDTYQTYRQNFLDENGTWQIRDVDTTGRQIIRVVDEAGNPVLNACVQIFNNDQPITSALTYATGMTLFFPNLNDETRYVDEFRVVVSKGDAIIETTLNRETIGGVTEIELASNQSNNTVQLDVVFLLDATGSMSDEIEQLQGNILTISEKIDDLPSSVDVQYGLVAYRDRGDDYVTRTYDFTDSVTIFKDNLLTVQAGGGGDYPESLNEGFDMALNNVSWRSGDAIRLVFLVADAPPHVDYQDDADYSLLMQDALARGIKVHPIASGGLQPEGEYILRQIAQVTMGRFLFLTYDDGNVGVAGDERPDLAVGDPEDEQGVGDYSVSQLDELVLRLITDEIAFLQSQ
ncbi:MAG: vWA domain-containing protein [Chloroflexota bacterium]